MAFFQSKHLWIKQLPEGVCDLVLDRHDSAVNYLDPEMLDDLERAMDAVSQAEQCRVLVVRSGKAGHFCHGLLPGQVVGWKKEEFASWAERGQQLCHRLAALPIPSAAVITGSCCDAGLELALACDHRVVVNKPSTSLGFPELQWGMIPCWGGTQRLPHLVGLENSLQMLLGGESFGAHDAWLTGLADTLAEPDDETPPTFFAEPVKRDWSSFPRRSWRERWLESNRLGRWLLFRGAARIVRKRMPAEMPAAAEMLHALPLVYQQPGMQPGLDFERQALLRIVEHPALHHLLRLLQQREKLRPVATAGNAKKLQHVGILGSGVAGLSLLLQAAHKGYDVVLRAEDATALGAALLQIDQVLQSEVRRGALSTGRYQKMLAGIRGTYTWTHFDKLDLVVDTTAAALTDRQMFYQEMEKRVPSSALLAALPHTFCLDDLQPALQNPERLVGLRILEPWNQNSLAEVVVPGKTSARADESVVQQAAQD